jgi:hypothetical protein
MIDHLVVTSADLASGVEFVRQRLGVSPQPGGEHARMGTHNCLLKLGEFVYLEVISPDPAAPKPDRPRWFELDHPKSPRLATWAARTNDIHAAVAASSEPLGNIEPMTRGQLSWLITIPTDGSLPLGGTAPAVIEWQTQPHPASRLPDAGCTLVRLEAFHPDAPRLRALLSSISLQSEVAVSSLPAGSPPYLVARVRTANAMNTIGL